MTSIINVAGIGLADPLLNAQTLGHEQRAVAAQARRVLVQYEQIILVAFKEIEDALVTIVQLYKALGGKMVAGIRRQALRS